MDSHLVTGFSFEVQRLRGGDVSRMHEVITLFGRVFGEPETYNDHRPDDAYLADLLGSESFVALAAVRDGAVIGGLAAYELRKFEQRRSEFYIYDLAVDEPYRRRGVARALIGAVVDHAVRRGAHAVFVQADPVDEPAVCLYESLGTREEVFHFDLDLPDLTRSGEGR